MILKILFLKMITCIAFFGKIFSKLFNFHEIMEPNWNLMYRSKANIDFGKHEDTKHLT